jgi:hypothetical protein
MFSGSGLKNSCATPNCRGFVFNLATDRAQEMNITGSDHPGT